MDEPIPSLPMRKKESNEHLYGQGRKYGLYEAGEKIDEAIDRLEKSSHSPNLDFTIDFAIGTLRGMKTQITGDKKQ